MRFPKVLLGLGLFAPALAMAESAGPHTFANSPTLWVAIIIGFIASGMTLRYAMQMKGSRVASILNLFGWGMLFVVLGFLSVAIAWAPEKTQKIVHDFAFIIGYALMFMGAARIRSLSA
jgi:hypothetical protein